MLSFTVDFYLQFKQFVPDWSHKIQDAIFGPRKLYVIDEQSQQDEVGKYRREVHDLQHSKEGLSLEHQQLYVTKLSMLRVDQYLASGPDAFN